MDSRTGPRYRFGYFLRVLGTHRLTAQQTRCMVREARILASDPEPLPEDLTRRLPWARSFGHAARNLLQSLEAAEREYAQRQEPEALPAEVVFPFLARQEPQ